MKMLTDFGKTAARRSFFWTVPLLSWLFASSDEEMDSYLLQCVNELNPHSEQIPSLTNVCSIWNRWSDHSPSYRTSNMTRQGVESSISSALTQYMQNAVGAPGSPWAVERRG
jgi:hypothetical protein